MATKKQNSNSATPMMRQFFSMKTSTLTRCCSSVAAISMRPIAMMP